LEKMGSGAEPPKTVERQREREDHVVQDERARADETVRVERAEKGAVLASEREETDKDLLRERARSDRAVATRDELLGVVGHDLRNMLGAMIGFATHIVRLQSQEGHGEQVVACAQRIQRAGARMNRLVGDLVDVASIEAGSLAVARESVDAASVVTEAVDTLQGQASEKGVSLAAQIAPALPLAALDAARILQVLINLVSNAIKFTSTDGKVVVHVERTGEELYFAVRDTGVGVPSDKLSSIFERFAQVDRDDRRGVGLGLYISKCIVQGHGGRIWAESKVGEGSTFCFTVPISAAP
jgi:signal transduction histidine kinase